MRGNILFNNSGGFMDATLIFFSFKRRDERKNIVNILSVCLEIQMNASQQFVEVFEISLLDG